MMDSVLPTSKDDRSSSTAAGTLVIDAHEVSKTYAEGWLRRRRVDALRGVSLQVERGQIFGLLGPNGAGKTTLIKVLLGIVRSTSGRASLLGYPAGHRRGRAQVGFLPESHRIPLHLTGNTALEYYGLLSGLTFGSIKQKRPELLDLVGLGRWGTTSVRKFSKGMLQRLGLAQAMLHDPPLLILDEPTDGVDPVGRREMREILQRLKQEGKTIFINSHLLQEVELVCDRVAIMQKGSLRHVGAVEELTSMARDRVDLRVVGDQESIQRALEGQNVLDCRLVAENTWMIDVAIQDELEIDRCVDRLRAAQLSIRSIAPRRRTLEQAFLDIVQSEALEAEVLE